MPMAAIAATIKVLILVFPWVSTNAPLAPNDGSLTQPQVDSTFNLVANANLTRRVARALSRKPQADWSI